MVELKIVLVLALVCLQVWCDLPVANFDKLVRCFMNGKGPFSFFFPFHIAKLPFVCSNFTGEFKKVRVYGHHGYNGSAELISSGSDGTVAIKFVHTIKPLILDGYLTGSTGSKQFHGKVVGNLHELSLVGNVSYGNQKVTELNMTVTFESIPLVGLNNAILPFSNKQTEEYYRKYFEDNKEALENETIALINAWIDTTEKFENLKKVCEIE